MASVEGIRFRNVHTVSYLSHAIGMLLVLTPAAGFALEPLTFLGFDKASQSAAAHEGMEEIFSGRCFHGAMPVAVIEALAAAKSESQSELEYDPDY